jgi:hypothetical protein
MGWRFYAQRPTGVWLWNDVPMDAEITDELSGPGLLTGTIPKGLDVHLAPDGLPVWLERGTMLYAEHDTQLKWVGVCSFSGATPEGRQLEFRGLTDPLERMPYDDEYSAWNPAAAAVVAEMLNTAQAHPGGNLGLTVQVVGDAPGKVGDVRPPARPVKPGRRKGETAAAYDDRLLPWEEAVDDWDALYADREPYTLAWYEPKFVGAELKALSDEVPFDYRVTHAWVADLKAAHVLELSARFGTRRQDVAFTDGVNIAARIDPQTSPDEYANDVLVLGAGEGRKMKRGRSSVPDPNRFWTGVVVSRKDVVGVARLQSIAETTRKAAQVTTTLDQVDVWDAPGYASVSTLVPGDEVLVTSKYTTPAYSEWNRITSIIRSTTTPGRAVLRFG